MLNSSKDSLERRVKELYSQLIKAFCTDNALAYFYIGLNLLLHTDIVSRVQHKSEQHEHAEFAKQLAGWLDYVIQIHDTRTFVSQTDLKVIILSPSNF